MNEEAIKKLIQETVRNELKTNLFTARKLTDTPTDNLQVVNRRYVTLNGTTAQRPTSSVIGQRYFDTTLNQPVWIGNGFAWVDANGNPA